MYRLFVAVDLPEEVIKVVTAVREELPGARWVPAEQLHLTLRFIGEVDEALFKHIKSALATVKGRPFRMALQGIGHFPPGKHPRVLWVGMEENEALLQLQQDVELALVNAGLAPEERRFSPHITIARLKETPGGRVLSCEEKHAALTDHFSVEGFHLYSSTLTGSGAIHRREATYTLGGI